MNAIRLKKGFKPKISGTPDTQLRKTDTPEFVGLVPDRIPFIKPRLLVEEGDSVAIGSPLFEDKRDPRIRFASPGGGIVSRIVFGLRRVILEIVITLDKEERCESFDIPPFEKVDTASRETLVKALLEGGMWPFFRALPFMDLADPDVIPPSIFVRLGDDEPFNPNHSVYLKNRESFFRDGVDLLNRLCDNVPIHLTGDEITVPSLPGLSTIRHFSGRFPLGNPCVQLYSTKTGPEQNRSWFIDGQDVTLLGEFFRTGRYPVGRIMVVGGSLASKCCHVSTRAGVPLRLLCDCEAESKMNARYIVGGVFTGFRAVPDSFMGFYQNALNLIDDGDREEPFGFIRPGYGKPSYSKAFLSAFRRKPFPMDCGQHGELRACVNCGTCAKVCPVDILPQFTMKCLVADEVEEALSHGLLDCAECGLCTYTCPSKIELCSFLKVAKARYYKEIA